MGKAKNRRNSVEIINCFSDKLRLPSHFIIYILNIIEVYFKRWRNVYFNSLLDAFFGPRNIFHVIECSVCGFDEIYYEDKETKKVIGKACSGCNFVQKFE
jgi:hypothetical protein